MAERLAERFRAAQGAPVELDGRLVHMLHELPVLTAPAELRIVWRDGAGTMQAWIGDAGMLVEDGVLRCSDGFAPPRFSDLEVTLALT